MLPLATILVPTDFSPQSAYAARHAAALADKFVSRIVLLHVMPPVNPALGGGILLEETVEGPKALLHRQLNYWLAAELNGRPVERVLDEGDPAEVIIEHAHLRHAGLIMMPTRGCGPFRRFILGSVTAKVLHDANCPVWTSIHLNELPVEQATTVRRILCAIDLTPESGHVPQVACELALELRAGLTVVHAIPNLEFNPETYFLEAEMRRSLMTEARHKI